MNLSRLPGRLKHFFSWLPSGAPDLNSSPSASPDQAREPLSRWMWAVLLAIITIAGLIRTADLGHIPPGFWYDEAIYSTDGYHVMQGHFPLFFDEGGHPREPLYPYSLGLFFYLFGPTVLVARYVSALWGTAAVAMFFPVARRLLGNRWALGATMAFSAFRWHVHFSRTIFRALLPTFFILLVVWLFLRWRERQRRLDAILCGAACGLGLYTYLSFRVAPVLLFGWLVWIAWKNVMPRRKILVQGAVMFAAMGVVFTPLLFDYLHHPSHFNGRTEEISMFEKTVQVKNAAGGTEEKRVPKTVVEAFSGIAGNALGVAKMWTILGDHVAKHNIPYKPVFDWVSGVLFYAGIAWCIFNFANSEWAAVLLAWLFLFSLASILSFGAPNLLRMQGAAPASILLYMIGLRLLVNAIPVTKKALRIVIPALLVAFFALTQLYDYFFVFSKLVSVRREFTADFYYEPAEAVRHIAPEVDFVYVPAEMMEGLPFEFITKSLKNMRQSGPDQKIPLPHAGSHGKVAILVTARSIQLSREKGIEQLTEVVDLPQARQVSTFAMPIPDENDHVAGWNKWAELWTASDK
jgi:4-amino-4-deoxy-L-arabinose transferase-like glycosyltransferase